MFSNCTTPYLYLRNRCLYTLDFGSQYTHCMMLVLLKTSIQLTIASAGLIVSIPISIARGRNRWHQSLTPAMANNRAEDDTCRDPTETCWGGIDARDWGTGLILRQCLPCNLQVICNNQGSPGSAPEKVKLPTENHTIYYWFVSLFWNQRKFLLSSQ